MAVYRVRAVPGARANRAERAEADAHARDAREHGSRPDYSLLSDAAQREPEGLCSRRFQSDFITHGLDYAALREGDTLELDGLRLRVTRVGKRCFPECALVQRGQRCGLSRLCAFAADAAEPE